MKLTPNKFGYVSNSVSVLSILAFLTAISSFIALEFLFNSKSNTTSSFKQNRTAYFKDLEALPVEPGQGYAYFKLEGNTNQFLGEEASVDIKLINEDGKNINAFGLSLFIPDSLQFVSKPENTLISGGVINFVEYQSVQGGTQVNIFGAAKSNTTLIKDTSSLIMNLKLIPKINGNFTLTFVKKVPQYPEILDLSSQSLLDITVLEDLNLKVDKAVALEPVITPESGEYNNAVKVVLNNVQPGSSVKYTIDNSDPRTSITAITVDDFPIEIILPDNSLKVFKAYTFGDLYSPSNVITKTYSYKVAAITIGSNSVPIINNPISETLNTITTGAKIYYTLNGTDPSDTTKAFLYDGIGINLNHTVILKAVAVKNGYANSELFTNTYNFTAPEVKYTGLGYCTSTIDCELGIKDLNDTTLSLRYDPKSPAEVPSKIDFIIEDSSGNTKLALNNITPLTNIFTVNIPNYKNYFEFNNPNYIEIRSYTSSGVYASLNYTPKLNTLPVIEELTPALLDTYSKASFKVSASDGGGVIENSDISFVELLRRDSNSSAYISIKKISTQPGSKNIIDFVIEDDSLSVPANYFYSIKVYDNLGLTSYSSEIPVRFFEKGDLNKDFKLDIPNDLFTIIKAIFGSITLDIESMDINLDTKVDPLDIIKLLKKLFI